MTARSPDDVRRLFAESFAVRDIAEPLVSFDGGTSAEDARAVATERDFDVVGVRRDGLVAGFVEVAALESGPLADRMRPLTEAALLGSATPLPAVLRTLDGAGFALVDVFGRPGGIVTRADVQKPPVRMWLFGIVTLVEMRFAELVEGRYGDDGWRSQLSEGRLRKAESLLEERRRRHGHVRLLDCLQFADKARIVARDEELLRQTVFESRRQLEDAAAKLEQLRNHLAHAQEVPDSDWETIVRLAEFVVGTAT